MPHEITHLDGTLHIELSGGVGFDDLRRLIEDVEKIEDGLEVTPHRILDIRETTLPGSVSSSEVWSCAKSRQERTFKNHFKSAIVGSHPVQIGLARMFQTLNTNPQIARQVFKDMNEANAWVNKPQPHLWENTS
jgi:hypothetical protein